jgi:hypothetical protein
MAKKSSKKTARKSGSNTRSMLVSESVTAVEASNYRTEIIHNVKADDVEDIIADRQSNPKYREHNILAEPDGEFTLVFIYDA